MRAIFIGGSPRSGTTLLGALLGGHPACLTVPESQFKIDALRRRGLPRDHAGLQALLATIAATWRFRAWEVSLPAPAPRLASYPALLEWLVDCYGAAAGRGDFDLWVDHTPENICYLQTLFEWFPDAKAVHIVRDGRAVAASVLPLDWGPNTAIGAAHYWTGYLSYGLAAESIFDQSRIVQIKYEDLVTQPESVLKSLCDWLGIGFHSAMLTGKGFAKPSYYSYQAHSLIGSKVNPQRADSWKTTLPATAIEMFEAITGDLLRYLGYELQYGLGASPISSRSLIRSMVVEACMEILNRLRGRRRIAKSVRRGAPSV